MLRKSSGRKAPVPWLRLRGSLIVPSYARRRVIRTPDIVSDRAASSTSMRRMERRTLALLAVLCAGSGCPRPHAPAAGVPAPAAFLYVGGFRPEIDVFRLDLATAALTPAGKVEHPPAMPSFLAFSA